MGGVPGAPPPPPPPKPKAPTGPVRIGGQVAEANLIRKVRTGLSAAGQVGPRAGHGRIHGSDQQGRATSRTFSLSAGTRSS